MRWRAVYQKHSLQFKFEAGTSRGKLTQHDAYYIKLWKRGNSGVFGLGECAPLRGLSIDDLPHFEVFLNEVCEEISRLDVNDRVWQEEEVIRELIGDAFPSIQFGFETAFADLRNGGNRQIFPSLFTQGQQAIPINGLIWMGEKAFMQKQIDEKIAQGFTCVKMKIGAIDFEQECALLQYIRNQYTADQITLRVDANGAFSTSDALEKLTILSRFDLHSIEQPIRAGQAEEMSRLCSHTPLPIALDEELIGVSEYEEKQALLQTIRPQYIILKPTLLGGFRHCQEWIQLAEKLNIGWWITSALESNIGLNAVSQFTATFANPLPQGLGTGQLYHNNIDSPLEIRQGHLYYLPEESWDLSRIPEFRMPVDHGKLE
jgi:o-succinylbenzoate synthase